MEVLLTNDDGIDGEGLQALASAFFKAGHDVVVVAPDCNNSAVSHKINMWAPLHLKDLSKDYPAYSLSGTPADCVQFALYALGIKPSVILSGINNGNNLGSDCMYSGTVAAAQEGAQKKIPSIALSTDFNCDYADFSRAAEIVLANFNEWLKLAEQTNGALNVNIPVKTENKGVRICRAANLTYFPSYKRIDKSDDYEFSFGPRSVPDDGDNDTRLYRAGYITVTPLRLNMTDDDVIERWKS